MWYSILEFLNVAGVVTNSFLVAFTSSYGRSWEGDLSATNRTQLVFNNTTNTTEQVVIITESLAGLSRLWLIIGFEVSPSFLLLALQQEERLEYVLGGRLCWRHEEFPIPINQSSLEPPKSFRFLLTRHSL